MKKVIPQKIVNIVYGKLLAGKRLERSKLRSWTGNWREETFYRSLESNEISNRFFKNRVTRFIHKCRCVWCINGKNASTKKRILKWENDLNDYIQERQ